MSQDNLKLIYPTWAIDENQGPLPIIWLPKDYQKYVKDFYLTNGKKEIEHFVKELKEYHSQSKKSPLEIELTWEDYKGLTNIKFRPSGGFDLVDSVIPQFQPHNLGNLTAIYAGMIAQNYLSSLLNSKKSD